MSIETGTPETVVAAKPDLDDPKLFFNRELSWLDFNDRVLQIAENPDEPLLERVKFCAIYTSNLDEFFMIRVAGVHDQVDAGIDARGPDGRAPLEVLDALRERVVGLGDRLSRCLADELLPALGEHGVKLVSFKGVAPEQRQALSDRFARQIFPVLTPLAVGMGRPFPYLSNLSLSLAVALRDPTSGFETFARVKVPKEMLPRFIGVGGSGEETFVSLEGVIAANLDQLFPGVEILHHGVFRVTRDADFTVSDEADDLLAAVETQVRRRRFGEVVRVEVNRDMHPELRARLTEALEVEEREVYEVDGPLDQTDLWQIVKLPGMKEARDPAWVPVTQPRLQGEQGEEPPDLMAAMRHGDILVHHPYDSFTSSVERFVDQAVSDPDVLAIKQTVYRTSDDSQLVPALMRASERGKQAVCLVELKARFDERANIIWARALEEAGVHVVYGLPSLKTHAKCILIVRREGDGVRHYVHVGTGNYHPKTARLYTDFGLFTADEQIGADVADMFNFLTGYARPKRYRRLLVAPSGLRDGILEEIERTIEAHTDDAPARVRMKLNSLVDERCIEALYRASQAGVRVDLNVRGVCCLRPGVAEVSENVRVVSVLGRFLEHSRVLAFERPGEDPSVWIGSADLMPRNLDHRVELMAPVLDPQLRDDILDTVERAFCDDTASWQLDSEGQWARRARQGPEPRSMQRELMVAHAGLAAEAGSGPEVIRPHGAHAKHAAGPGSRQAGDR
ncbi:MAG: polyphosphate kinase 1 [Solirubrobacteraceae bacterium]